MVEIFEYSAAELNIEKSTSAVKINPDQIFTYTLGAELILTDTNTYSLDLIDILPIEINVITETIELDGVSASELYAPATHKIRYQQTGTFVDTYEVEIIFQVFVESDVISGTLITNQLNGQASVNGLPLDASPTAEVVTQVVASEIPIEYLLFLPVVIK